LGRDTHLEGPPFDDLISLVGGPNRIKTLRNFVLDSVHGVVGKKFDLGDIVGSWEDLREGGWQVPDFNDWKHDKIYQLVEAGDANGIKVSGSTIEAVEVRKACSLELGNRLIISAYQTGSLDAYSWFRADEDHLLRLPGLDVDKLDTKNLKLVKIDLPEEGWFQLSLE
jgi:hypothetical protein